MENLGLRKEYLYLKAEDTAFVTKVVTLFYDDPHACQLIPDFLQCSVSDKRFA